MTIAVKMACGAMLTVVAATASAQNSFAIQKVEI